MIILVFQIWGCDTLMRMMHEKTDAVALVAEVFRALGYEGASLSCITERTGLGKGSLYHFFPGGKEEMAACVLANVSDWFEQEVYAPLRHADADEAIRIMWENVSTYFRSGRRICLVGAFALEETRERFPARIADYFQHWIEALTSALARRGGLADGNSNRADAEDIVLSIQGALVLSRALNDDTVFSRAIERLRQRFDRAGCD